MFCSASCEEASDGGAEHPSNHSAADFLAPCPWSFPFLDWEDPRIGVFEHIVAVVAVAAETVDQH